MAFTAAQVMKRASTILQDADAVRWTAVELCDWLNEAQRAIVVIKPNARAKNVVLTLVAGTKQTLPAEYTVLSRVIRNVGVAPGNSPGKAVKTLARREILDAQIPDWHNPTALPYAADVTYVLTDLMAMRDFWVVPGNTGTGKIEATVGAIPADIPLPAGADQLDVDKYTTAVDMDDVYQGVLLDLILFRAFSKDSAAPDAAHRSGGHLQLANAALQAMGGAQSAVSLATAFSPTPAAG